MAVTFGAVVERFGARPHGAGWMARCPAHDDAKASLSIAPGDDGRTLIKCHAGCSTEAVLATRNLTLKDLQPTRTDRPEIVATYDYNDEGGTMLNQVLRDKQKNFRQRRPDGAGGWTWKLGDVRRVLYHLDKLQDQAIVYKGEGEKDADRLWALGLPGTTNAGGAGKWRQEYTTQLVAAGVKLIVVLPDNDDPGRAHAAQVAASCHAAGLQVKVVALPNLPPKGDVSDWLDAGHTAEELLALVKATPQYPVTMPSVEPDAPLGLSGAEGLDDVLVEVEQFIRRYVVLTRDQSTLTALWVAQTHLIEAFEYVSYLNIHSPIAECGKTRLLEVLEAIVRRPWLTGRVTAAVLMRKVDAEHPVLLLDESDAAFSGEKEYAEALRGLLNSGFHRTGKASACVGQGGNITYKDFATFGPKAIAGIGKLPSTVESRSIPIALKRRTKDEVVAKWRRREGWAGAERLRAALGAAAAGGAAVTAMTDARPEFPDGLSDRAEDVLEPLFVIADSAGGVWPHRARLAALRSWDTRHASPKSRVRAWGSNC
ncbi:MAG TPA: DUF3631 domain-containing protein [Vicinamibacterales bacterium]|nr:DUF3631 domain-containing protein [Vicinamibacterales bacterium]